MKVLSIEYTSPGASTRFTESLTKTGFAVLTDHPIPAELIYSTYGDWRDFFSKPVEEKLRYKFNPELQDGYFPFRTENAKDYSIKDLKEFYHVYPWTKLPDGMSDRTWELFRRMHPLATQLLRWVEDETPREIREQLSMPLPQMIEGSQETLLRPLHYPPLTGSEETGAIRAAAHEDINLLTLLPAATTPGLQVKDASGNWHNVSCDPGNLVVNACDMLQLATKGFYRSTTHRVVNPTGAEARLPRYSMPLFLHARKDVWISDTHTQASYLRERLGQIGLLNKSG